MKIIKELQDELPQMEVRFVIRFLLNGNDYMVSEIMYGTNENVLKRKAIERIRHRYYGCEVMECNRRELDD